MIGLVAAVFAPAIATATDGPLVATFRCDVTPPRGQPLFAGDPLERVAEPLLAKGIVIEAHGTRRVLCAIDWCLVANGTHRSLREQIAAAVAAEPGDVAVQTLHQHNAPMADIDAFRILARHGDATVHLDPEWLAATEGRIAAAARESLARLRPFDRVGTGRGRVDRVASNRRIRDASGGIPVRGSLAKEPLRELPEGIVDPFVRTVTLAAGDEPLVRIHAYATHPQVKYRDGIARSDFVGIAREELERREGVFQVYLTGCAGDVTVGKYNDGSDAARRALADRLLAGFDAAIAATRLEPVGEVGWRTADLVLPRRNDAGFTDEDCLARVTNPKSTPVEKLYLGAMRLASRRRADEPVTIACLSLGPARILALPGEPLVEFQLFAQRAAADAFVVVAGYGDNATGYLLAAADYGAGGYEPTVALCTPESERILKQGIATLLGVAPPAADEPPPGPEAAAGAAVERLPRLPPLDPEAALAAFSTAPGYRMELVAAEPQIHSPVAIDFDERGRLWAVEMIDYSEQERERLGTVRILEDRDGDGRCETSAVFADGLSWPTGVLCHDGGAFVCAAPDILFLRDTDGDGREDERRVVFTGFGRTNVQGLLNSLRWSLDGRVHGATSSSGGSRVRRPDEPGAAAVNLDGRDFSFDPRRLDLRSESGCLQHGMTLDDWGRKFVSGNSNPVEMVFFEDRYAARNPAAAMPPGRGSIAVDGGTAEVFRASPVEPWRIARTRMRLADPRLGAIEGGGRAAGYFTGASGITACRGDAYPDDMRDCLVVGDVGGNLVHRERLSAAGPFLEARRIDDHAEFVRSADTWFRPAQFANAPDGTLYVVDVYREVIEHPKSLPPGIKEQLDLTSGRNRGRIYRIAPDGAALRRTVDLGAVSTADLVPLLAHRNGWHRDTASRLILGRLLAADAPTPVADRDSIVAALDRLARDSAAAEGRVHALHVLGALGRLQPATVLQALDDGHARVREHAVLLAERFPADGAVLARLCRMTEDGDARVRYQLAFSLGEFASGPDRDAALARLLVRDAATTYARAAVASSLARGAGRVLGMLAADGGFAAAPVGGEVVEDLARQIGRRLDDDEVGALEAAVAAAPSDGRVASRIVAGYLAGRRRAAANRRELVPVGDVVESTRRRVVEAARATAVDASADEAARIEAAARLALGEFAASAQAFDDLLTGRGAVAVRQAAMASIDAIADPAAGRWLLDRWSRLDRSTRAAVGPVMLARDAWVPAVLDAVESGQVPLAEFDPAAVRSLVTRKDAALRRRAERIMAPLLPGKRDDVVAAYRPALGLDGHAARGRDHFVRVCAQCHRVAGTGHEIGPSLAAFAARGPEAMLVNVFDPNREVNPLYVTQVVQLADGRTLSGMISDETSAGLTVRRGGDAIETVPRADIEAVTSTGRSLMPEGLEKELDPQAFADLLAFLKSAP